MKHKNIIILIIQTLTIIGIIYIGFLVKINNLSFHIETNIEENKSHLISTNYPKTGIKKLDNKIEEYIGKQLKIFKANDTSNPYLLDRDELNIDYELYTINDRYINISLKVYISHPSIEKEEYKVETFYFDKNNNSFYKLEDIFKDKEEVLKLINDELGSNKINNLDELKYSLSEDNLIIYDLRNTYQVLTIPLSKLSLKLKIETEETIKEEVISLTSRVLDPTKPTIALTFDDGPSAYTKDIINTLKENDVNATFFVLGNKVEIYQDIIKESIKNGNEIGNHTYNHKWLSRLSTTEIISQIENTQNILKETLNYTPTHLRPTYGSVNNRIRNNTDLIITLWTIDTKDWKIKNVDRIVEKATENIEDGDIILMHDIFERTSKALKKLIPLLKEQGFQIVTISELEEIKLLRTRY